MRPSGSDSYDWCCLFNLGLGCLETISLSKLSEVPHECRGPIAYLLKSGLLFDFSSDRASGNLIDPCALTVCESKNLKHINERSG